MDLDMGSGVSEADCNCAKAYLLDFGGLVDGVRNTCV